MKTASCHPERKHFARGFCRVCYYGPAGPGRAAVLRYRQSEKGRAVYHRYETSAKGRATKRALAAKHAEPRAARRRELRYGLTPEQYDRLLILQDGGCAICGRPGQPDRRLSVDHAHVAGCDWRTRKTNDNACSCPIRGILCQRCNAALVALDNDTERQATPAQVVYLARRLRLA